MKLINKYMRALEFIREGILGKVKGGISDFFNKDNLAMARNIEAEMSARNVEIIRNHKLNSAPPNYTRALREYNLFNAWFRAYYRQAWDPKVEIPDDLMDKYSDWKAEHSV
jgi:hypothetical protein